jgi:hypothetical protein
MFARSDIVTEDTYAADIERKTRKWGLTSFRETALLYLPEKGSLLEPAIRCQSRGSQDCRLVARAVSQGGLPTSTSFDCSVRFPGRDLSSPVARGNKND